MLTRIDPIIATDLQGLGSEIQAYGHQIGQIALDALSRDALTIGHQLRGLAFAAALPSLDDPAAYAAAVRLADAINDAWVALQRVQVASTGPLAPAAEMIAADVTRMRGHLVGMGEFLNERLTAAEDAAAVAAHTREAA